MAFWPRLRRRVSPTVAIPRLAEAAASKGSVSTREGRKPAEQGVSPAPRALRARRVGAISAPLAASVRVAPPLRSAAGSAIPRRSASWPPIPSAIRTPMATARGPAALNPIAREVLSASAFGASLASTTSPVGRAAKVRRTAAPVTSAWESPACPRAFAGSAHSLVQAQDLLRRPD